METRLTKSTWVLLGYSTAPTTSRVTLFVFRNPKNAVIIKDLWPPFSTVPVTRPRNMIDYVRKVIENTDDTYDHDVQNIGF